MGGWGGQNPWPLQWGDPTSPVEDAYNALRSARGVNGSGPPGGIDDAFLWAKAEAVAANDVAMERATIQAFPFRSTDHLPVWETRFGIQATGTEQDRRNVVAAFDAEEPVADIPSLAMELTAISKFIGIGTITRTQSTYTMLGKMLAPRDNSVPYGGRASSDFPNYASEYVMHITWDVVGAGGLPGQDLKDAIKRLLNDRLPAWVDWLFHPLVTGFYADGGPDGLSMADWSAVGWP